MGEIVSLLIDIGLGALAYRMARAAKVEAAGLRSYVDSLTEAVTKLRVDFERLREQLGG